MAVFDDAYVQVLSGRWSSRPKNEWPTLAAIALLEHRDVYRAMIEEYVARLHEDDRRRITANLRNEKQFVTTFGELLVGGMFATAGFSPRYEPRLTVGEASYTPDWLIHEPLLFACDVFTAGLEKDRSAAEKSLRELNARLTRIPLPYILKLEVTRPHELTAHDRREIASAAERWLSTCPAKAALRMFGHATLEVMGTGGEHVSVITAEGMHVVETPPNVPENFIEKAKRYAPLDMPLIVAAVKHYQAEIDTIDIENVLFGTEVFVSLPSGEEAMTRQPGGVFATRPQLSAAVWLEPFAYPPVTRVWANPVAAKPVPREVLEQLAAFRNSY